MKVAREVIFGNHSIGLFANANNSFAVLPAGYNKAEGLERLKQALDVEIFLRNIYDSPLVGLFMASNSKGLVSFGTKLDFGKWQSIIVNDNYTCLGNLVLANDKGAVIAKSFSKFAAKQIEEALKVPVTKSTIAGLELVGSCGIANNNGALVHPQIKKREAKIIEESLGVKVDVGTLNRGSPYVGSCAIANDRGAVVGWETTPVEITRLEDALG